MAGRKVNDFNLFDRYSHYVPGVADLLILLVWFIVGVLLGNVIALILTAALGVDAGMEYSMIVSYPVMFIPAMIYASVKSRANSFTKQGIRIDSAHFGTGGGLLCAVLAAVGTIALAFCTDAVNALMPAMPEWLESALKSMTSGDLWVDLLCVSIFAPFFEEWLCRGQVLRGLLGKGMKPVWAIVISAVFFALIHANPWQAIPAFILGCFFGYVYYKTGSLKLTMLMHCANNTFAVICSHTDKLEEMENWKDVFPGAQYWILFGACLLLVILTVNHFKKIELQDPQGNCDVVPSVFEE